MRRVDADRLYEWLCLFTQEVSPGWEGPRRSALERAFPESPTPEPARGEDEIPEEVYYAGESAWPIDLRVSIRAAVLKDRDLGRQHAGEVVVSVEQIVNLTQNEWQREHVCAYLRSLGLRVE